MRYLRRSWRTRPLIAEFVNVAFLPNFLRIGMTIEEIAFDDCARAELPGAPAALSTWDVGGSNRDARAVAMAGKVAGLLAGISRLAGRIEEWRHSARTWKRYRNPLSEQ